MWWKHITTPHVASNGHQTLSISRKFSVEGKQQTETSNATRLRMSEQLRYTRTNEVGLQNDESPNEDFPYLK